MGSGQLIRSTPRGWWLCGRSRSDRSVTPLTPSFRARSEDLTHNNANPECERRHQNHQRHGRQWLDGLTTGDPEVAATTVRLLLAHLTWNSKRLLGAMVLDRLDAESLSTRADFPDRCQRLVNGLDSVNDLNP